MFKQTDILLQETLGDWWGRGIFQSGYKKGSINLLILDHSLCSMKYRYFCMQKETKILQHLTFNSIAVTTEYLKHYM